MDSRVALTVSSIQRDISASKKEGAVDLFHTISYHQGTCLSDQICSIAAREAHCPRSRRGLTISREGRDHVGRSNKRGSAAEGCVIKWPSSTLPSTGKT